MDLAHEPNLNLPVALVSRTQILQVFTNLVANAIAYTRHRWTGATFDQRADDGRSPFVGARVFNDGPPIDPEDLPHIFDRFYRGRTGQAVRPAGDRVGAGDLQGDRRASRRLDRGRERIAEGTTFTVWLPAPPAG